MFYVYVCVCMYMCMSDYFLSTMLVLGMELWLAVLAASTFIWWTILLVPQV